MKKTLLTICCLAAGFLSAMALPANGVIYLSPTGVDTNDGTTWATAKRSINAAFEAAKATDSLCTTAKDIWAKAGVYLLDSAARIDGIAYSNIAMYGGFKGIAGETVETREMVANGEAWEFRNPTVFDGQDNVGQINGISARPVVGNVIFDGISFENGGGDKSNVFVRDGYQFKNCMFVNNHNKNGNGGGAMNVYTGITDLAQSKGILIENCYFKGNKAKAGKGGGAVSANIKEGDKFLITGCLFEENIQAGGGAAISTQGSSSPDYAIITNCRFFANECTDGSGSGGTEYGIVTLAKATIMNCIFSGNIATVVEVHEESGVTSGASGYCITATQVESRIINCLIYNNGTGVEKSVVYTKGGTMFNTTIVNNLATESAISNFHGDDLSTTFTNCLLSNNQSASGDLLAGIGSSKPHTINYCAIDGSTTGGQATINNAIDAGSSIFVAPTDFVGAPTSGSEITECKEADFRLVENSPLIAAGDIASYKALVENMILEPSKDIYGKVRYSAEGTTICVGAAEFQDPSSVEENFADINVKVGTDRGTIKIAAEDAQVSVYNLAGVCVDNFNVSGESQIEVTAGVYAVKVISNEGSVAKKVIVQ